MKVALVCLCVVLALALIFFVATPIGRTIWNSWWHDVEKADDNTSYENRKMVEDTCRAMIASYKTDVDTYNMYKDSDDEEKLSWAEQARMRANKTANSYNEYVLKNSYVWNGNVPIDITNYLPPV